MRKQKAKAEMSKDAKLRKLYVGRRVAYSEPPAGCEWYARVIDVKCPYGTRVALLLQPEAGSGIEWRGVTRCRIIAEDGRDAPQTDEPGGAAQPTA